MKKFFVPTFVVFIIGAVLFGFYSQADKPSCQADKPSCQAKAIQKAAGKKNNAPASLDERLAILRENTTRLTDVFSKSLVMILRNRSESEQRLFLQQLYGIINTKIKNSWKEQKRPMFSKEVFTEVIRCSLLESLAKHNYTPPDNMVFEVPPDPSKLTNKSEKKKCACCTDSIKALRQKLQKAREASEAEKQKKIVRDMKNTKSAKSYVSETNK